MSTSTETTITEMKTIKIFGIYHVINAHLSHLRSRQNLSEMTLTSLTFEELDAILSLIEFHDDWDEVSEIVGADVHLLYEKLSEMRDEV